MTQGEMAASESAQPARGVSPRLRHLEGLALRASEWLNPILVKEARQALKSRQFVITFSLLLLCGWGWSLIGIMMQGGGVYYAANGASMLIGYYLILAIPLLLIVPFSAFRSLAGEREDGTFELLSITTLSARQVITGKLGSAIIQMMVYYSALSPCIAFTYLLRGVDILTIGLILLYTFMLSTLLSVIGLMVATISNARHWQAVLSVAMIIVLIGVGFLWSSLIIGGFIVEGLPFHEDYFVSVNLAFVSLYATTFAVVLMVCTSAISFASDNRSTRIRWALFVQHAAFIGWMLYFWINLSDPSGLVGMIVVASIYWTVMGALMIGELGFISPRVQRSLPSSVAGRSTLSWFIPGSGTGYVFAVCNLATIVICAFAAAVYGERMGWARFATSIKPGHILTVGSLYLAYMAGYLGLARLAVLFLRRFSPAGIPVGLLLTILLAMAGAAIPFFGQLYWNEGRRFDYSIVQMTNWVWTPILVLDSRSNNAFTYIFRWEYLPVWVMGAWIFFLNLLWAARDAARPRLETPSRVTEDEIELHPEKRPDRFRTSSPWND